MLDKNENKWERLMFLVAGLYILLALTILATFVAEPKEVGIVLEDDHVQAQ